MIWTHVLGIIDMEIPESRRNVIPYILDYNKLGYNIFFNHTDAVTGVVFNDEHPDGYDERDNFVISITYHGTRSKEVVKDDIDNIVNILKSHGIITAKYIKVQEN
jgi:hypothetical protein